MGSASSKPLEELTKEEIAAAVSSLGANYEQYANAIMDDAIDGELLASLDEQDLEDVLEELKVSSKIHRKVLTKTLEKAKNSTKSPITPEKSTALEDKNAEKDTDTKDSFEGTSIASYCDESELQKYADIGNKIFEKMGPNINLAGVNLLSQDVQYSLSFGFRSSKGGIENVLGVELPIGISLCRKWVEKTSQESIIFRVPDKYPLRAPNGDVFPGPHRYIGHIVKDENGERVGTVCALEKILSPEKEEEESKDNNDDDDDQERLDLLEELAVIAEENLKEGKALRYRNEMLRRQVEERKAAENEQRPEEDIPSPNKSRKKRSFKTCIAEEPIYHQGLAETEQDREHLPLNFFEDLDKMGMTRPPVPKDDMERVAAVEAMGLMHIHPQDPLLKSMSNLVSMAARLFGYQFAQISVHNHEKEFTLCRYISQDVKQHQVAALKATWTALQSPCSSPFMWTKDRNTSICNYVIHKKKTVVLNDAWNDKTFWWSKKMGLFRAYVGSPILNMDGHVVANLCLCDFRQSKNFNKENEVQLEQIAFSISQLLENWVLRREMEQLEQERNRLENMGIRNVKTSPPQGEAAIVLTDVQGSTSLWEQDPTAMQDALKVHDEIMRTCYKQNFGYEITTEGDAFLLAFHDAVDAIRFALNAQTALHEANWSDDILKLSDGAEVKGSFRGLRVRMGIHFGPVSSQENEVTGRMEYKGETWNIAKSIEAMCHGGQILVTADAWRVASWVAESLNSPQVVDVGEYVVATGKGGMRDGIISKRVIQLVPNQLAFDYFSSRRYSETTENDDSGPEGATPEVVTTTITTSGRSFPPPLSKRKVRASFYDAPYVNGEVTVAFIYTSEVKENVEEPDSVLAALSKFFSSVLVEFNGYECKTGMYAFDRPSKAVTYGLKSMQMLQTRPVEGQSNLARLLKVGVHSGVFTSMGPNPTTGRADYYGQVVNRAARVAGAAGLGEVQVGVIADGEDIPSPPTLDSSIQTKFVGLKQLKGVSREMAVFSCL